MEKKTIIFVSIFILVNLIWGSVYIKRGGEGDMLSSNQNSTSTIDLDFSKTNKTLIANLPNLEKPSGKCGYEYFYKIKGGDYVRLNKIERDKNPLEGVSYKAFEESLSGWDDVSKKVKEPDASVIALIYTDACGYGTSTPIYYYKDGQESKNIKNTEFDGGTPIQEIIKGKTFEDVESTVFSNQTAKLMECTFNQVVGSAENLLDTRQIHYYPVTVTGQARPLSEEQKNYVIKNGSNVVPLNGYTESGGQYVETTIEDESAYGSHFDCGDGMSYYTAFSESIDVPNVLIRRFRGYQDQPLWNKIIIVK